MDTQPRTGTPFPNIPPIIESDDREYRDTGVPSTVAIAGTSVTPANYNLPIGSLAGALVLMLYTG
jgi:hypothetical protein